MRYKVIEKNANILKLSVKPCNMQRHYIADPDREGEAISWHVYELLRQIILYTIKPFTELYFMKLPSKRCRGAVSHLVISQWNWSMPSKHVGR
ncbi:MAG: toprim domain-containing protein [Thiotrichaceae bacterium]